MRTLPTASVLLALTLAACLSKPAPPPAPPVALLKLLNGTAEKRAQLEALVAKSGEWEANAGKFDKLLALEGYPIRIQPEPLAPDVLEAQLRDGARRAKLQVKSLVITPPPAADKLPETAPADSRYLLDDAQLVSTWKVALSVSPAALNRIEALRILLRAGDRLWRMSVGGKTGDVQALALETYGSREVVMPKYLQNEDVLETALAEAKLPTLAELQAGPHAPLAKDLVLEFDRVSKARAALAPKLGDLAAQHVREERYALFHKLARAWHDEPAAWPPAATAPAPSVPVK